MFVSAKQEHLGIRRNSRAFAGISGFTSYVAMLIGSNSRKFRIQNQAQSKDQDMSKHAIAVYQYVNLRSAIGTVFMQREIYL